MPDLKLLHVAQGKRPADLAITNGQVLNVHTREIYPGGVAICGERIAAQGDIDYTIGPETQVIDAGGLTIAPGFVEGHIHPESSCLSITRFAEVVLAHGTTSVFTDLHEIGVVAGLPGIDAALAEGRKTGVRFFFVVPSHVPFFPSLETSGGLFDASIIAPALKRPDAVGLSEVVSFYVNHEHEDLFKSIDAATAASKALVGHGPHTHGTDWNAFVTVGITNDHEAITAEDVLLRARNGVYAHLRHCLICETLPALIKPLTEGKIDSRYLCLVTDDTSAIALTELGHMDYLARMAMGLGVDFVTAMQMVTINTAVSFRMEHEIGSLSPGRFADINLLSRGKDFTVEKVVSRGRLMAEKGRLVAPVKDPPPPAVYQRTFHLKSAPTASDLIFAAPPGASRAKVHYMKTLTWIPLTEGYETELPVRDGFIRSDPAQDVLHIAVVERHHRTGNIGRGFIGGFGLKRGAFASSVAHDNHNIVTLGVDAEDLAVAVNRVAELHGGLVIVVGGKVIKEIPLPQFGLLTPTDPWVLAKERHELLAIAKEMGCELVEPFMFLSFITLVGFPCYAVTDHGYIDCVKQTKAEALLGFS
jgi:adenine deaminase